ncbi:hypothetical protein ACFL53_01875 [Pseudomonadota bacterium]
MSENLQTSQKNVSQRPTRSAKRGGRNEQAAKGERLISGSLFLLTVATIVGFFIQQFIPEL